MGRETLATYEKSLQVCLREEHSRQRKQKDLWP